MGIPGLQETNFILSSTATGAGLNSCWESSEKCWEIKENVLQTFRSFMPLGPLSGQDLEEEEKPKRSLKPGSMSFLLGVSGTNLTA